MNTYVGNSAASAVDGSLRYERSVPETHGALYNIKLFGNLRELIRARLDVHRPAVHATLDGNYVNVVDAGCQRANRAAFQGPQV